MTIQRRTYIALVAGLVSVAVSSPAAAQGDRPQTGYWYCYSLPGGDPIYVTPVWDATAIPDEVQAAFRKMLTEKYDYRNQVLCAQAEKSAPQNTLEGTQAAARDMFAFYEKQDKNIVQTGWTNPTGTAPPATVTWGVCRAIVVLRGGTVNNGPFEIYLSDAFSAGNTASLPDAQAAFRIFVVSRYGLGDLNVNPGCEVVATEANALNDLRVWALDGARRRSKVIETGWKFAGN